MGSTLTDIEEMGYFATDFDPTSLEVERKITLDFLRIEPGMKYFVLFLTPFLPDLTTFSERVRSKNKDTSGPDDDKPLDIAEIVHILPPPEKGKPSIRTKMRLLAHTQLISQLNDSYKDGSYAGRLFQIEQDKEKRGTGTRKYKNFSIVELKAPKPTTAPPSDQKTVQSSDLPSDTTKGHKK